MLTREIINTGMVDVEMKTEGNKSTVIALADDFASGMAGDGWVSLGTHRSVTGALATLFVRAGKKRDVQ